MKKKIIFIIVSILVIITIILISLFLKKQNEEMLGIENTRNNINQLNTQNDIDNLESNSSITSQINEVADKQTNSEASAIAEIIEVTDETFDTEVLQSEKTVLIDFYTDWCEPCKILSPIIEEIALENPNIKVVRINVDNELTVSMKYQIMSIPTMVVIKDGEETNRLIGVVSKEKILNILD